MKDYFSIRQQQKTGRKMPVTKLKILTIAATVGFIGLLLSIFGFLFLFAWFAKDLPRPDNVQRSGDLSTIIYDRSGQSLYDIYGTSNRIPVTIADVPDSLKKATVSVEDKEFYKHQGLSTVGMARAFIGMLVFRNFTVGGGSTLTQQLVKNTLLTREQTFKRKIKEAILAIQIERKYTKDEILQMYFNNAPYGGPAVGVEAASQYFFGKHTKDLTFVESIVLAGLPQSPTRYNPYEYPTAYIARSQHVIARMKEDGVISTQEAEDALKQLPDVKFGRPDAGLKAHHFVAYIKNLLVDQFGEEVVQSGGLRVTTSLDWELQQKAEKIVKEEVDKLKSLKVSNGAAVVLDPKNGQILAMVGSKDYNNASDSGGYKFNVVTQGLRQPGSSIKPIAYATALEKGYTLATVLVDADTKYPSGDSDPAKKEYNPKNYDGKFHGPMTLRYALGNSINTIAVKVTALVGVKAVLQQAFEMGLTTLEPTAQNMSRFGLSLALGGGEVTMLDLANAYGVLATGGYHVPPVSILKVEDVNGKTLFEQQDQTPQRVLSPEIAFLISHALSDNDARTMAFGPASSLAIPKYTVAVKTGTTDNKRDNWTIGYTPSVVVGTWVGNNDNSEMNQKLSSGITGAAPIWNRIMKAAVEGKKDEPFTKPSNIVEIEIDSLTGGLPIEGQSKRKEYFLKGTEPTSISPLVQKIKVAKKDNNKLASPVDIAKSEYDTKDFIVLKEQDPVSSDGKNRWQEAIDAWIAGQNDNRYKVPKDTLESNDQIVVIIKEPNDNSRINNNSVHVSLQATTSNDFQKMELYLDGTLIKDTTNKTWSDDINIPNGSHELKARAMDTKGNSSERTVHLGINQDYTTPAPTQQPTQTPQPSPTP